MGAVDGTSQEAASNAPGRSHRSGSPGGRAGDDPSALTLTGQSAVANGLDAGARILAETPPSRWAWFEDAIRLQSPRWLPELWSLPSSQVPAYLAAVIDRDHAAALLSMHPQADVRLAALRVTMTENASILVPVALLRCTDPLAAIREPAQAAIDDIRAAGRYDGLVPYLGLMANGAGGYLDDVCSEVVTEASAAALIEALRSPDLAARRQAARALVARGDSDQVFEAAADQDDPLTTMIVVRGLSTQARATVADLDRALHDVQSHDWRRVVAALPIVGASLGSARADAALLDALTNRLNMAPVAVAAQIVLSDGSTAGRRLFAEAWNKVDVDELWQIGDTHNAALAQARWESLPDTSLDDWNDLTTDPTPAVAAGAAALDEWLGAAGPSRDRD